MTLGAVAKNGAQFRGAHTFIVSMCQKPEKFPDARQARDGALIGVLAKMAVQIPIFEVAFEVTNANADFVRFFSGFRNEDFRR